MPLSEIYNLQQRLRTGDRLAVARAITIVENDLDGSDFLLSALENNGNSKIVGVTGPPGAGKSTIVNALLEVWTGKNLKVAVIAVDPSSPFHFGSLLGDRIRMSGFYNHPNVFIRSLASRGALGGLHPRIYEITDIIKEAAFDIVLIETVGVGQSEVEVAGIADSTVVVLVPEAGDIIQTMKAGLLEIADIFVVNKSDRAEAESMYRHLRIMTHEQAKNDVEIPVIKCIANTGGGVSVLADAIDQSVSSTSKNEEKRSLLKMQKLWQLIVQQKMRPYDRTKIALRLKQEETKESFNIYRLAAELAAIE